MFGIWGEYYWLKIKRAIKGFALPLLFLSLVIGIVVFGAPLFKIIKENAPNIKKPELEERLSQDQQLQRRIYNAVIAGEYENAKRLLNQELEANPDNTFLKTLYSNLMDELKVDFKFQYLPKRKRLLQTRSVESLVLTSEDPYYLSVHASDHCYLYIFQLTALNDLKQLFPSNKVSTPNPIPPGPLRIPDGADWFYLDNIEGVESIYLVASRWRNEALEELSAKIKAERDPLAQNQLVEQILSRLKLEEEATDRLPGLVFGMFQFKHKALVIPEVPAE